MLLPLTAAVALLFAQQSPPAKPVNDPPAHGIDAANLDRSVKPGNDFFTFCNGAWLQRTEIPPDRSAVGVFTTLDTLSSQRTADLIAEVGKSAGAATAGARKIADLYNSYMDEAGIEAKGLAPLRPQLDAIAAIRDEHELARALGETLRADVDPLNNTNFHTANLFGLWVAPAFDDPEHYTAYLLQGGLEMPDREYYLGDNERLQDIRASYLVHVAAVLKLAGFSNVDARADRIVTLEHDIAQTHLTLAASEDVQKANNTWKRTDFGDTAPGLDWVEFFRAAGLTKQASFVVWQPSAIVGESALVASTTLDVWRDWLAFHLIETYARVLPKAFADAHFDFYGKTLSGTTEQRPRWQRAVASVNAMLGDEVGKMYVQRYFPPEAKAQAQAMVTNIIAAFRKRIDALTWMDPSTKAEAQAKLGNLYVGIGYPETWRDYSKYEVKADDLLGNLRRGSLFQYHFAVDRLGAKTDRKEWAMTPQTIDAVNLPLQNALNFPAAILQPPFFDPKAAAAVNYGAIGSIIGHEISHTFDTEGAAFDSRGRLRGWWTADDLEHFEAATSRLTAQYDHYEPFSDLAVNGTQTLAENIADLAGLAAAYDGYRAALGTQSPATQDGFSGDQQFFIAFGQNWERKSRKDALRQQILTDPHAPAQYRSYTVRNIDAWYTAFDVKDGDKLYLAPQDRVRIW